MSCPTVFVIRLKIHKLKGTGTTLHPIMTFSLFNDYNKAFNTTRMKDKKGLYDVKDTNKINFPYTSDYDFTFHDLENEPRILVNNLKIV